ncbi:MFS transporter [Aneurinibacillus migulanus]|uniref:MFS transporter n=1 Tax=Aneurinibacillus migulanus TaxID=47500 RepID=A0A0D1V2V4_ANEMI|nr:MFS transporter [Aneurinibacillus migulanus]KIV53669.1 MFS transporter [Aneurinibacillus migulanus]KON97674.1 MFS transporter [Aneurinibacillus migulanus]MED0894430.1 MFS transporter [Aneurinibacillus migulanus]MED1617040.1 MFS transporter [Aneurinibacillus migulanus]SDJ35523.1 Predicted arabinose efflux permease, MFS family [Aneurinibacillus migulanus]
MNSLRRIQNDGHKCTIFAIVTFAYWFSLFVYVPILPSYVENMESSYIFIGFVLGSYGLMQIVARLPFGILSDYMNVRRPFVIFGLCTSIFSCFGFALTDGPIGALVFRAIAGISAATWVAFTVLYASYFSGKKTAWAMGSIQCIMVIAQLISMGLSGFLVNKWGWHAPFWLGGIVGGFGLVLSLYITETEGDSTRTPIKMKELTSVIRDPTLCKVSLLSIFAHSILFITMFGFMPAYALHIGADRDNLALLVFSFMLPHAIASLVSGKILVPILGQWTTLMSGFLGSTVFTLMIPFIHHFGWLCLAQIFNGFTLGLTFPLLMSMSIQSTASEKKATAMGFYQAVYAIGMFIGPFLAGGVSTAFGLEGGFILASTIGMLAACLSFYWSKEK